MQITQERLKELFYYNPHTGKFTRKVTLCNRAIAGSTPGSKCKRGYIQMPVDGKKYKAHRLAWLYMTGSHPCNMIDHINHIKDDNRFCNLRMVDNSENKRNGNTYKNNKSGFNGVYRKKCTNKWYVNIGRGDGKQVHIGSFYTFFAACYARHYANLKYNYHKNHGL